MSEGKDSAELDTSLKALSACWPLLGLEIVCISQFRVWREGGYYVLTGREKSLTRRLSVLYTSTVMKLRMNQKPLS